MRVMDSSEWRVAALWVSREDQWWAFHYASYTRNDATWSEHFIQNPMDTT